LNKQDWRRLTYSLRSLREKAAAARGYRSAASWLRSIGVIPDEVLHVRPRQPILNLDADKVEAGYLAAVAFEWDSWGPASPLQFIDALEYETAGTGKRDAIAEILTQLGRATEEDVDTVGFYGGGRYPAGSTYVPSGLLDIRTEPWRPTDRSMY
jgi:hypothetical protein